MFIKLINEIYFSLALIEDVIMEKLAIKGGKPVSEKMIPIAKPLITKREISAAAKVLRSGKLRQGEKTVLFERRFAEYVGARYACATSSGTASLHIAYLSIIREGDEVILPSFTFISTASMVVFSGGVPVFADVDLRTFTLDSEEVKNKITNKTRAIVPVHLFGNSADLRSIPEIARGHNLTVISDAAQALGTRYDGRDIGSYDDVACYSFYPTKNITTCEGGMLTTNEKVLHDKFRLLRHHGESSTYYHTMLGFNYRMTDVQAAIGIEQLEKLDIFLKKRRNNAGYLTKRLKNLGVLSTPYIPNMVNHSFNQYTILLDLDRLSCNRDQFVSALRAENIDAVVYYPRPLTLQPVFMELLGTKRGMCPVSEDISERVLSLPVHPSLSRNDLELICEAVNKVATHFTRR